MTIGERVSSVETSVEFIKEAVERVETNQRIDAAQIHTKLNNISHQIASANTKIEVEKAQKKVNDKWKGAIFGGGFTILLVIIDKVAQYLT